jgi:hypothetical protein
MPSAVELWRAVPAVGLDPTPGLLGVGSGLAPATGGTPDEPVTGGTLEGLRLGDGAGVAMETGGRVGTADGRPGPGSGLGDGIATTGSGSGKAAGTDDGPGLGKATGRAGSTTGGLGSGGNP